MQLAIIKILHSLILQKLQQGIHTANVETSYRAKHFKMETTSSMVLITFVFTGLLCWYIFKAAHIVRLMCTPGMEFKNRRLGVTMISTGFIILLLLVFILKDQKRLLSERWALRVGAQEEAAGLFLLYLTPLTCGIGNVVLLTDCFFQWWVLTSRSGYTKHWPRSVMNIALSVMPWILIRVFSVECLCGCYRQRFRTYSAVCAMVPACLTLFASGVYMCTTKKRVLSRSIPT